MAFGGGHAPLSTLSWPDRTETRDLAAELPHEELDAGRSYVVHAEERITELA